MDEGSCLQTVRRVVIAGAILLGTSAVLNAQNQSPAQSESATGEEVSNVQTPQSEPMALTEAEPAAPKKKVPFQSKAWGARLETDPPSYVKTMDQLGIPGLENVDWLEFGIENTTRFEYRSDLHRPDLGDDEQILMRSRAYVGIRNILDPFRFGVEFQDSRQWMSDYPETDRDVDEADLLQAFAELYFKDALGEGYPVQVRAGRMTLDCVDRRLIARNRWRNTTNAFDGFLLRLGEPAADWEFDFFAAQPVERRMRSRDRGDEERWLYGLVGAWRGWSKYVTFEPYYFILDEDRKDRAQADREIHTLGLHVFGPIVDTAFDYDVDTAFQFGEDGDRKHRAMAAYGELGYTFEHAWKPRLSISTLYASGDRDPTDGLSERFDRLFQAGHCYSTTDLFAWQNSINPKLRLSAKPLDELSFDIAYGGYWLASDSDSWINTGRRDAAGDSGDFVGQEIELRARYKLHKHVDLEAGYSHFFPGPFVRNTGDADDGDMFYVQTSLHL